MIKVKVCKVFHFPSWQIQVVEKLIWQLLMHWISTRRDCFTLYMKDLFWENPWRPSRRYSVKMYPMESIAVPVNNRMQILYLPRTLPCAKHWSYSQRMNLITLLLMSVIMPQQRLIKRLSVILNRNSYLVWLLHRNVWTTRMFSNCLTIMCLMS